MLHKSILCALFCVLTLAGCAPAAPAPLGEPAQSAPASPAPEDADPAPPAAPIPAPEGERARELLAGMTDEEKVGQLFLVSIPGTGLDAASLSFLTEAKIGNVILFGNNCENGAQISALTDSIQRAVTEATGAPALIAVDQEGGEVTRVTDGATVYPGAMAFAASGGEPTALDPVPEANALRIEGEFVGEELRALGINCNLAPVADVNTNPLNPVIGVRSYGDDPERVAGAAAAYALGLQSRGVLAVAKHYPGHGDTSVDSHYGLPVSQKSLDELAAAELVPFLTAGKAGVAGVMAAHILYPRIDPDGRPATLSKAVLTGMLREGEGLSNGFEGLIFTDSMRMGAVTSQYGIGNACVLAVNAGADILTTGTGGDGAAGLQVQRAAYNEVLAAVKNGMISRETLDDRVGRILFYKEKYGLFDGGLPLGPDHTHEEEHARFAQEVSDKSMTLLRDPRGLLPLGMLAEERLLAISPPLPLSAAPAGTDPETASFAFLAADRFSGRPLLVDPAPDGAQTAACAAAAAEADRVVIAMTRAEQAGLVRAVADANPDTVVLLLGSPYLAGLLPPEVTAVCGYEYTPLSTGSAVSLLAGGFQPRGALPVKLD
ncbi:glycoside hydrolase family 3 protein [Anaerotruncus sp. DFI.9.16]|uniref:glycoside hydrolase family 3 protein n=1 Tax=Anaerotruncus sp. DFI.9.16 TaxID=2965275 RepID=UPI00210C945C|nr:glycoside hydrolase family 3 protein [Anaerotruncus sp. DFI.9.16]MCQ4897042.1 glycoside hydrolase family 3 protein [Anaerotruncus sp. DFI.9.16]